MDKYEQTMNKQLERYQKIMQMPASEREKYAEGIRKLETQIEQLREATGLDMECFMDMVSRFMRLLDGIDLDDSDAERLGVLLDEAGKCYNIGDIEGTRNAFKLLQNCAGGIANEYKRTSRPSA